jgi:hypothetical protein
MASESDANEDMTDPLDQSVESMAADPELGYAIKSSRRSLLQHAAQQNPTWTFAELRGTYGNDGGLAILSKII